MWQYLLVAVIIGVGFILGKYAGKMIATGFEELESVVERCIHKRQKSDDRMRKVTEYKADLAKPVKMKIGF